MADRTIFIAMPFRPELNYFYLYLRNYIERTFSIKVERGDEKVLTKPLMQKIRRQIQDADLIVGDVTNSNPNVLYELGLAHAYDKPVIFITQEPPEQAPVDIQAFEFIQYDLGDDVGFLNKIDNAIRSFFRSTYEALYEEAQGYLQRFNADRGINCQPVSIEVFQAAIMSAEQYNRLPPTDDIANRIGYLLPKVAQNFTDQNILTAYYAWSESANFGVQD